VRFSSSSNVVIILNQLIDLLPVKIMFGGD